MAQASSFTEAPPEASVLPVKIEKSNKSKCLQSRGMDVGEVGVSLLYFEIQSYYVAQAGLDVTPPAFSS